MNYKILGANSIYICGVSNMKSGYDTYFHKRKKVKNICIYVNSSIILCYSSTVRHSRLLDTQPLRHSQSLDRESP